MLINFQFWLYTFGLILGYWTLGLIIVDRIFYYMYSINLKNPLNYTFEPIMIDSRYSFLLAFVNLFWPIIGLTYLIVLLMEKFVVSPIDENIIHKRNNPKR